jgi:hypothetical protein
LLPNAAPTVRAPVAIAGPADQVFATGSYISVVLK